MVEFGSFLHYHLIHHFFHITSLKVSFSHPAATLFNYSNSNECALCVHHYQICMTRHAHTCTFLPLHFLVACGTLTKADITKTMKAISNWQAQAELFANQVTIEKIEGILLDIQISMEELGMPETEHSVKPRGKNLNFPKCLHTASSASQAAFHFLFCLKISRIRNTNASELQTIIVINLSSQIEGQPLLT